MGVPCRPKWRGISSSRQSVPETLGQRGPDGSRLGSAAGAPAAPSPAAGAPAARLRDLEGADVAAA